MSCGDSFCVSPVAFLYSKVYWALVVFSIAELFSAPTNIDVGSSLTLVIGVCIPSLTLIRSMLSVSTSNPGGSLTSMVSAFVVFAVDMSAPASTLKSPVALMSVPCNVMCVKLYSGSGGKAIPVRFTRYRSNGT